MVGRGERKWWAIQTLDHSLVGITDTITVPWTNLGRAITPGPGHLILVLGAPGVGKSAFSLAWLLALEKPTLYLSLDSDLATQAARTASALSGISFDEVRLNVPIWQEYLKVRQRTLPMMLDAPVRASQVDEVVQAFEEYYSEKPEIVVVDNLKDVVDSDTYEAHRMAVRTLHQVAKKHRTTILLLHHLNRTSRAGDGYSAPSQSDGQFTGEQDSEFILGLWRDEYAGSLIMNVRVLKNRFGPKGFDVRLFFDQERMRFYE